MWIADASCDFDCVGLKVGGQIGWVIRFLRYVFVTSRVLLPIDLRSLFCLPNKLIQLRHFVTNLEAASLYS